MTDTFSDILPRVKSLPWKRGPGGTIVGTRQKHSSRPDYRVPVEIARFDHGADADLAVATANGAFFAAQAAPAEAKPKRKK